MIELLLYLFVFAFGAVVGSFLNVCIYRLPRGISIVGPRSFCPNCGAPIPARLNIPVAGWILLRGRARCCGSRISPRYPVVEAAGGASAVLSVWALGLSAAALRAFLLLSALIVLGFMELDRSKPPRALLLLIPVLLALSLLEPRDRTASSLVGAACGLTLALGLSGVYRLCLRRPFEPGRLLLLALGSTGAALGTEGLVFSAIAAPALAALTAAALLITGRMRPADAVPLALPALAACCLFLVLHAAA